ncbi:hypothetical protein EG329_009740 [Mollisiaceae sp. DMI_Dod_QoI]|nr:hypothetical protein EG329_009740 [Helotiales sp. DMI_Dod_QoI]
MNRIQTQGRFSLMELPAELRVKIYKYLLICESDVELPPDGSGDRERQTGEIRPAVAILQTCWLANDEGVPILWGKNKFAICLPVDLDDSFFLRNLRWSTIQHITSLTFTSDITSLPVDPYAYFAIRPHFTCSGLNIISRHSSADFRYSPYGPNKYMSLSIRNWASTKVTQEELDAISQRLEELITDDPADPIGPMLQNAPVNGNGDPNANHDADAQT